MNEKILVVVGLYTVSGGVDSALSESDSNMMGILVGFKHYHQISLSIVRFEGILQTSSSS